MWMMPICMLFLVVLLFAGGGLFSAGYLWPVFVGAFVVAHLWMMFKGHGGHRDVNEDNAIDTPRNQKQSKLRNKKDYERRK